MKAKSIRLNIPDPCHESWYKMEPREQGRFCNVCSKTVVDFTQYTESDLVHYFREYKGGTCGRYKESQLNYPMQLPAEPRYHPFYKWVAGLLMYFGGWLQKSEAQSCPAHSDNISYADDRKKVEGSVPAGMIRGRVTDENGQGLAAVQVICENIHDTVVTDNYGGFTFSMLPFEKTEKVVLKFQRPNYSRAEYHSLYGDIPSYLEMSLTEIPMEQRIVKNENDSLSGDSLHPFEMKKVVVRAERPERVIMGALPTRIIHVIETEPRRRPPIDMMGNTQIID